METFSLRLLFALAVQLNLNVTHLDVTTAFLNGNFEETIYMQKPDNLPNSKNDGKVLRLKKAIYGLKNLQGPGTEKLMIVLLVWAIRHLKLSLVCI